MQADLGHQFAYSLKTCVSHGADHLFMFVFRGEDEDTEELETGNVGLRSYL